MANDSQTPVFASYKEFWPHYVSQHQHPFNQFLHAAGTIGGLVCLVLGIVLAWPWLMAVLPVGYGLSWLGHFLVEKNRPLTFTYPLWSFRADYELVIRLICRLPLMKTPASDQRSSRQAA
jgi:hypothetical protein